MKVKIFNLDDGLPNPTYATEGSAGMDLLSREIYTLLPQKRVLIKTGILIELPQGYEAQIRPRSGLAYKHGITVLNSPGTIDSDYRGEIGVLLINHSDSSYLINRGERIAQMVIAKYEKIEWEDGDIGETNRGEGGFGSTGK